MGADISPGYRGPTMRQTRPGAGGHGGPGTCRLDEARPGSLGPVAVDKVLLAEPRGFCAGVEKAIKALAWMVRVFEPPVYCYHEIVHNQLVVEEFRALGVIFVDDVAEVPPGAPLMLSAHGTAPAVVDRRPGAGPAS